MDAWNYSLGGILNYNLLINPFSSDTYQSYNTIYCRSYVATKSIHIIIQELMNLLHGNKFSPWEDFFVNPFGSVLTNYVSVHVCTGAGRSTCGGTMKLNRFRSWEV